MSTNHITHEAVEVKGWRISSYTIDDDKPRVSAHLSAGGVAVAHYWTPDEARAWRDAIDRVLAAIPPEQPPTEPSAGERRAMGAYEAGELG